MIDKQEETQIITIYKNDTNVIATGSINKEGDLGKLQQASDPFSSPGANILVSAQVQILIPLLTYLPMKMAHNLEVSMILHKELHFLLL